MAMHFDLPARKLIYALAFVSTTACAAEVELAGIFGRKAVLVIDGGAPQTLAVGQRSREGVKVVSVSNPSATVDVNGELRRISLGEAPLRIAGSNAEQSTNAMLRLVPDARGHYWTVGMVNGASLRFMVDTGATYVAINANEAKRAGIDYRAGQQVIMNTANGQIPAWLVTLDRVRIGGISLYSVQATIHESGLPVALLGMSFISRLSMRSEGSALVLQKQY